MNSATKCSDDDLLRAYLDGWAKWSIIEAQIMASVWGVKWHYESRAGGAK